MDTFILLRGASLGVLIVIMLMAASYWHIYASKLLVLLTIGISAYVFVPIVIDEYQSLRFVVMLADTIPMVFLLFCQSVFADHKRPAALSLLLGLSYYGTGLTADLIAFGTLDLPASLGHAIDLVSRALIISCLLYVFYIIIGHWRSDLVASRRVLRLVLTSLVCSYISVVIIVETVVPEFSLLLETLHSVGILLVTLGFTMGLLAVGANNLTIDSKPVATDEANKTTTVLETQELAALLYSIETECSYRNMELTISSLAELISVPEHHLRSLINRHLGYRNFNDFLNQYRIGEAAERLTNEKFAKLPIMTIAMDAGYRSMTTFNKAFKSITGKTPRDYRFNDSE
jgi:AraC-like DNA-binding protein